MTIVPLRQAFLDAMSAIQILSGYIDRDGLDDEDCAFVDRLTDPRRYDQVDLSGNEGQA